MIRVISRALAGGAVVVVTSALAQPANISIIAASAQGSLAAHPGGWIDTMMEQNVRVSAISGGARVNAAGAGSLLTAVFADVLGGDWPGVWFVTAAAKDHVVPSPATVTVAMVKLYDPQTRYEVRSFKSNPSPVLQRPSATVTIDDGYVLTGGGCYVDWKTSSPTGGNMLIASAPLRNWPMNKWDSWECTADHLQLASTASISLLRP